MNTFSKAHFFRGITRNIFVLGLVSMFTDLSSQMVFPLIPLFMTTILGTGAHAVGIVEGSAETTASLLKVFSGYWSDRISRRKPFVLFGYTLSSLTKPLFAVANTWFFVLGVRVVERIGKGIRNAPRDALVAESCDESVRGKAYGFHRAMDGIGSILGAILAFALLPVLGYRKIFLYALVPGITAAVVILFVREKKAPPDEARKRRHVRLSFAKLPGDLKLFIIAASIFSLGHFGYAFLLLRAINIGLPDNMAILFYVLFYSVYTLLIMPFGVISDRIGRKPVLMTGYILFAVTSSGLIYASSFNSMMLLFVIYGLFYSMIDGVQRAFVVDMAPGHLKATALGTFHTTTGLMALPCGFIAGLLWDRISPESTFVFALVLSVISVFLFAFVKKDGD